MAKVELTAVVDYVRRVVAESASGDQSDSELLQAFLSANNHCAFAQLVKRHGCMVMRICRRVLKNEQDAEDAFQAAFLVLAIRAAGIRKQPALGSWLHRVAWHVAKDARRAAIRRNEHESEAVPARPASSAARIAGWRELQAILDEEIQRLPVTYRDPFILCCLENKRTAEAAQLLDAKEGTIWSRVARAKEQLQKQLTKRGVSLTAVLATAAVAGKSSQGAVPASLISSTTAAAMHLKTTSGLAECPVSPHVVALARGMSKALFISQVRASLVIVAVATFVTAGLGVAVGRMGDAANAPINHSDEKKPEGPLTPAMALDADGRRLPESALARLGSRKFRVAGRNDFALPTPDGKYLLVHPHPAINSSFPHGLMLLDRETGFEIRGFQESYRIPNTESVEASRPSVFSPDGKTLYALAWEKSEEPGQPFFIWAYVTSPCRRVVLAWDVATGKLKNEWPLPWPSLPNVIGASMVGLHVSPDGLRLYTCGALRIEKITDTSGREVPGLHVLDTVTGKVLESWEGADYPVGTTAEGKELITFREAAGIVAYDVKTGKSIRTFALAGTVLGVALSSDQRTLAAVGISKNAEKRTYEIKVWEAATGREIRLLNVDAGPSSRSWHSRVAIASNGKTLFLGTASGRILRWDLGDGGRRTEWQAHQGAIADMSLQPGETELVSAGMSDSAVKRWDAASGKALSNSGAYIGEVAFARTPDGKMIAAVDEVGRLDLWDPLTARVTKTVQTPGRRRHKLRFSPDGKHLLVAAETGPNTVWDLSAGTQVVQFDPPAKLDPKAIEAHWNGLDFSSDGRWLVASKFGFGTWLWSWPERRLIWHQAKERYCRFSPDNKTLFCADWGPEIQILEASSGVSKGALPGAYTLNADFSPDKTRLVTSHLGYHFLPKEPATWQVRDGATGTVLKKFEEPDDVQSARFSPSGWLLAVATGKTVRVYDTLAWQEVTRFDGHEGTVHEVFFGPDEATLISTSPEDGTALVWSLKPPISRGPLDPVKLWADLAGDGATGWRAVWAAAQNPDLAVRLFQEKWPVAPAPIGLVRIRALIAKLDSNSFIEREAAHDALMKLDREAEAELRKAYAETTSAEVKQRTSRLIQRFATPRVAHEPEEARQLRAVWALHLAGTPEARSLLESWAKSAVGIRGAEAAAVLHRFQQK